MNKYTNSVVQINPDALKEADKIDDLIANTKDKSKLDKLPLLGIPFTAKDSVCIRGLAVTVGIVSRKDKKADKDSEVGESSYESFHDHRIMIEVRQRTRNDLHAKQPKVFSSSTIR